MQFRNISKKPSKQEGKCVSAKKYLEVRPQITPEKFKYVNSRESAKLQPPPKRKTLLMKEGSLKKKFFSNQLNKKHPFTLKSLNRNNTKERRDMTASVDLDDVEYIPILAVTGRVVSSGGVDSSKKKKSSYGETNTLKAFSRY
ncbi:hypothetical protein JTB14_036312 [Gonioctena quinquepunctata]|nr:hypothetical protein JTB14_036312 [Gonioctena quinquepunctata]